jgi:hypothetical protein
MNLHSELGEFAVKVEFISLETEGDDFYIRWSGKSPNIKDAFSEIDFDIPVSGIISKSSPKFFGNFTILPYERQGDFYIDSILKPNLIGIESYNKKFLTIDSVVSDEKFNFLTSVINGFDLTISGNLSKQNVKDAKYEQKKIIKELKSIKDNLDGVIQNNTDINTDTKNI